MKNDHVLHVLFNKSSRQCGLRWVRCVLFCCKPPSSVSSCCALCWEIRCSLLLNTSYCLVNTHTAISCLWECLTCGIIFSGWHLKCLRLPFVIKIRNTALIKEGRWPWIVGHRDIYTHIMYISFARQAVFNLCPVFIYKGCWQADF